MSEERCKACCNCSPIDFVFRICNLFKAKFSKKRIPVREKWSACPFCLSLRANDLWVCMIECKCVWLGSHLLVVFFLSRCVFFPSVADLWFRGLVLSRRLKLVGLLQLWWLQILFSHLIPHTVPKLRFVHDRLAVHEVLHGAANLFECFGLNLIIECVKFTCHAKFDYCKKAFRSTIDQRVCTRLQLFFLPKLANQ